MNRMLGQPGALRARVAWILLLVVMSTGSSYTQSLWEKTGGPPGGRVTGLARGSGGQLVAGTRDGKVYVSADSGRSWEISNRIFGDRVESVVFTRTGAAIAAAYAGGLYRSTNGGRDWVYTGFSSVQMWSLAMDTSGTLFAGSENPGKIYRSTTDGTSWMQIHTIPSRVSTLYAKPENNYLFAAYFPGIQRSTDGGDHWYPASTGLAYNADITRVISDSIGTLYASTYHTGEFYRSTDDGLNWTNTDTAHVLMNKGVIDLTIKDGWIIAGTWDRIARSSNSGYSWEFTGAGMRSKVPHKFASDGAGIYSATWGGGVYYSADNGVTWVPKTDGLSNAWVEAITFDDSENLYAGAWEGGLFSSSDKGASWKFIDSGFTEFSFLSVLSTSRGTLYAGTERGLFRSSDLGAHWMRTPPVGGDGIFRLIEDRKGNIYASDYLQWGLWRSRDDGTTWVNVSASIPDGQIWSMAVDSSNRLYVGTSIGHIYRSTDAGDSWEARFNGLAADKNIMSIAVAPNGKIYVGTIEDGVFRSTDGGESWVGVSSGIADKNINCVAVNARNEALAGGYFRGLYILRDTGTVWVDIASSLAGRTTVEGIIFDRQGYTYLATEEAVWRSKDTLISGVDDHPPGSTATAFVLEQNYPNPFNPATQITFALPSASDVRLVVYDVLGREVAELVRGQHEAGYHTVTWGAPNCASGVYFVRLTVTDELGSVKFTQARKVLLLR